MTSTVNAPLEVSYIITIIVNGIACPLTLLLNVLVIKAVKTTPRLRTNSNILLAFLAVTDALTGLFCQPSYILWRVFLLFRLSGSQTVMTFYLTSTTVLLMASHLHLMLVTFERLAAIKFTMHYQSFITNDNLKMAVSAIWSSAFMCGVITVLKMNLLLQFIGSLITSSCIFFVALTYVILYHEIRRHQRKIKAQQLPQEEVERFIKESKALKTTLLVVGAVVGYLLPLGFCLVNTVTRLFNTCPINIPLMQTFAMLNSLVNPLIYCWRQKEMRNVMFKIRTQVVHPAG